MSSVNGIEVRISPLMRRYLRYLITSSRESGQHWGNAVLQNPYEESLREKVEPANKTVLLNIKEVEFLLDVFNSVTSSSKFLNSEDIIFIQTISEALAKITDKRWARIKKALAHIISELRG